MSVFTHFAPVLCSADGAWRLSEPPRIRSAVIAMVGYARRRAATDRRCATPRRRPSCRSSK